jgi:hypothetical protein
MGDISTEHKTPTNRCKRSGRKRVTCGAKRKRLAVHCGTLKQKRVVLMIILLMIMMMMMRMRMSSKH